MQYPFTVGSLYSRKDVYNILKVPGYKQDGNWNTGYNRYNEDVYIFANINSAGRTGHDYKNKFIGDDLEWFSKKTHSIKSPTIKRMIDPKNAVYIFTRDDSNDVKFTYQGVGTVKEQDSTTPVRILWEFNNQNEVHPEKLPEEVHNTLYYYEGKTKRINVNIHERNPLARKKCIEYYGVRCTICNFDFKEKYGEIGNDYIQVHHLIELSNISEEYEINPISDLRPVCPNCHAMLHRRKPAYTIGEIKSIIGY